jgi:tetratricopeptide (TPR) repeat protein
VRRLVGLATITALLILGAVIALHGYPYRPGGVRPFGFGIIGNTPVAAADYLEANGVRGNVFNSYETGPYLIYRLYPAIRVAMDSRNDVYGENLYGEYELALRDREILGALLGRIDAAAVVLGWMGGTPPPAARLLRTVGSWRPVYFDDAAIVYMRSDGGWPGLVARDGYTILDPADYRPGGLRREDAGRALAEADRAVRSGRGSSIACVMRIDALMALGRRDEALLDEERLLATRPALASIYVLLGDLHLGLGDRDTAAARYRRALDLEPGWPRAAEGLEAAHP